MHIDIALRHYICCYDIYAAIDYEFTLMIRRFDAIATIIICDAIALRLRCRLRRYMPARCAAFAALMMLILLLIIADAILSATRRHAAAASFAFRYDERCFRYAYLMPRITMPIDTPPFIDISCRLLIRC